MELAISRKSSARKGSTSEMGHQFTWKVEGQNLDLGYLSLGLYTEFWKLTKQGQALISEVYLSARQLIVLELELVLELGAVIQASTETLTHRKPNYVPLFKRQIS